MLPVMLYPTEYVAMMGFLSRVATQQIEVPLVLQPLPVVVLMAYQQKLNLSQLFSWKQRKSDRRYRYRIPIAVGRAMHQELQCYPLTSDQQSFLEQLDLAIVNYRLPLSDRLILTTNLLHAAHA